MNALRGTLSRSLRNGNILSADFRGSTTFLRFAAADLLGLLNFAAANLLGFSWIFAFLSLTIFLFAFLLETEFGSFLVTFRGLLLFAFELLCRAVSPF